MTAEHAEVPHRLLVGIKTVEEPGKYALNSYIRSTPLGKQAPIPEAIRCPKAERLHSTCLVAGYEGMNPDGRTRHNNWQSCHLIHAHFKRKAEVNGHAPL